MYSALQVDLYKVVESFALNPTSHPQVRDQVVSSGPSLMTSDGKTEHLTVVHFYIQSFSLTEYVVIVEVRKYLGCLSAVCVFVCLCVCLCVCSRQYSETTQPISMKLSKINK